MTRKPKAEQRRRDLCDAAIELLASDGARGLTHLRVDRHAGFADGTTSFYYQTRAALLRGAMDRVIELDVASFTSALDGDRRWRGRFPAIDAGYPGHAHRRRAGASRARARFELIMIAARDPELGTVFDGLMEQFVAISEAAVAQVQPVGAPPDRELIQEQAFAVVTFLGGFLFRLAYGLTDMDSAKSLEKYLHSVIAGVAADHQVTTGQFLDAVDFLLVLEPQLVSRNGQRQPRQPADQGGTARSAFLPGRDSVRCIDGRR